MRKLSLVFLLLLGACSPRVEVTSEASGFDPAVAAAENWAVGPVVLDSRLQLDGVAELEVRNLGGNWAGLSEQYAEMPFFALLEQRPEMNLAPYTAVAGNVDPVLLDGLARPLSRGEKVSPAVLEAIGERMPDTHYLVTAIIKETRISTRTTTPDMETFPLRKDEKGLPAEEHRTRAASVTRWATVRLMIFDLYLGHSVWEGESEGRRDELYNWKRSPEDPGVKVEREGEDPVRIDLEGSPLRAPSLERALKPAFNSLAKTLLPTLKKD